MHRPTDEKPKPGKERKVDNWNEFEFELTQRIGQQGSFHFVAYFKSDTYIGFDKEVPLKFTIDRDDD